MSWQYNRYYSLVLQGIPIEILTFSSKYSFSIFCLVMSSFQVVFDSNHKVFHYKHHGYTKYDLDRLFANSREMRFKNLDDAKLMIEFINRGGKNIKVYQKDNVLYCTCKNYENYPFL